MQNFKFLRINSYRYGIFEDCRFLHNKSQPVVIAAAARTPWGKYKGQLESFSVWRLGCLAVDCAVKQAAIPLEQIQQIFMNESTKLIEDNYSEPTFSDFLQKAKYTPITVTDNDSKMQSFLKAVEVLGTQQEVAVVMGGSASTTHTTTITKPLELKSAFLERYISKSLMRYEQAQKEAVYAAELLPLTVRKQEGQRRNIIALTQDEILAKKFTDIRSASLQYCDGAAALVLTNLGSLILGYSPSVSLAHLLTHITHSLQPLEHGCVVCSNNKESLALIIQKLPSAFIPERLPLVTLYTKDSCPLCDILIEELEYNFSGEYELEKIFIDTKHNVRFLRLYRFDIPVVFLNNQFLCMHRLNHTLLRKRLNLLKKSCLEKNIK